MLQVKDQRSERRYITDRFLEVQKYKIERDMKEMENMIRLQGKPE